VLDEGLCLPVMGEPGRHLVDGDVASALSVRLTDDLRDDVKDDSLLPGRLHVHPLRLISEFNRMIPSPSETNESLEEEGKSQAQEV
jgi:hypothetical protein